jgi:dihydroflavonol-4-reductase
MERVSLPVFQGQAVRCLVTGATGFIGLHLVRRLTAAGHDVACSVRKSSRRGELEALPVRMTTADLETGEGLDDALAGCDVVFHLAGAVRGLTRGDFFRPNADGVRHVVEAAGRCAAPPVVVVVSSLAAAGPATGNHPHEPGDVARPISLYGQSKLAGETAARQVADRVPITIVRPPIVFGEGDRASFEWFRSIAKFRLHAVPGFGPARYSIVHVDDVAVALIAAAERGRRLVPGDDPSLRGIGVYYVAADETPTYREIGELVAGALGIRRYIALPIPGPILRLAGFAGECAARLTGRAPLLGCDKAREATAGSWTCSTATARAELDLAPSKNLAAQFAQAVAWYRERKWL